MENEGENEREDIFALKNTQEVERQKLNCVLKEGGTNVGKMHFILLEF